VVHGRVCEKAEFFFDRGVDWKSIVDTV